MADVSLKTKAVRGVAWFGGSRIIIQALTWMITIAVARILAPSDYGLFGMALLYVGLVDFLNELGFGAAIVQKKTLEDDDLHTLFWFGCFTGTFLYGLTLLVAPVFAWFFNQPALVPMLWALGANFIVTSLRTVPWNILTRDVDFKKRSVAEVFGNVAAGVITIVLAYNGWGVWSLVWGFLARNVLMTAQVYIQTRWRPRLRFSLPHLKRTLAFSLNVSGYRAVWYLHVSSDRLMVGKVLGDQALGYYSIAMRLTSDLLERFLAVINQVAFPVYSRLQDEPERLKNYFLTSLQVMFAVIIPVGAGLFLVADDLIPLLLTAKWAPIIPPFKILALVGVLVGINTLAGPVVLAKGHSGLALRFHLICLLILPASFLVGTQFGLLGVCLVWWTVYPVLMLYWVTRTRRIIGYQWLDFWQALKPAAFSAGIMFTSVTAVQILLPGSATALTRLAVTVPLGVCLYIVAFLALFPTAFRKLTQLVRPTRASSIPLEPKNLPAEAKSIGLVNTRDGRPSFNKN